MSSVFDVGVRSYAAKLVNSSIIVVGRPTADGASSRALSLWAPSSIRHARVADTKM